MSWQYSDAPSHIAPEVGANLLTGDGPWSGVVLEPGAVYALSVEVNAPGETTVGWGVTVTDGSGGEYVLADPADGETVPGGQWVTVTRNLPAPAFPTTATIELVAPTDTQTRNPSMGVRTGRTVLTVPGDVLAENIMASGGIVAGTPDGARVELTDQGLISYDRTGTETAHIVGEGGEFVGGEFRTSDTLPGQVTLSDGAYVSSFDGIARPGINIEPENSQGYASLPGIGPDNIGISIDGGKLTTGESSQVRLVPDRVIVSTRQANGAYGGVIQADAGFAQMRTDGTEGEYGVAEVDANSVVMRAYTPGGVLGGEMRVGPSSARLRKLSGDGLEQGWVQANPTDAELAAVSPGNTYVSRIRATPTMAEMSAPGSRIHADATETYLQTSAGGIERYLAVDADGVWVKTNKSGTWEHYNLEDTATMPAPEVVPVIGTNGWSADGSPTGGIIVTHSTTGRVCTARLRITRTGDPVTFGAPYQTIGSAPGSATMWIPPELRIPATDYFGIRIPVSQPATGILFADLSNGEFRVKADTSATINTGKYITVDMTWFIPN